MNYHSRIQRVRKLLKAAESPTALLVSSAPELLRSRDIHYPYRGSSNLFYLTGITAPGYTLLLSSQRSSPLLLTPQPTKQQLVWDGPPPDFSAQIAAIDAEVVGAQEADAVIDRELQGINHLYHDTIAGSTSLAVATRLVALPSDQRGKRPRSLTHVDSLLAPLRLIKDSQELAAISHAISVTSDSIREALPRIVPGALESDVARAIEAGFLLRGGETGFRTIVGTGPSAAVLHYIACSRRLKKGELVLIDCGAEVSYYNGDITRVFPCGSKATGILRDLYQIVLESQEAAIAKVRDGVKIGVVYQAAATVLLEGLQELRILPRRLPGGTEAPEFRRYFPHGIGHSLGIDVHDAGESRGNLNFVLKEHMVFTVEPGLYNPKRSGPMPACGIRIEDDVLVTKNGATVLSGHLPKTLDAVEALMGF
jgi:Xaa-Pro aminopeptidase